MMLRRSAVLALLSLGGGVAACSGDPGPAGAAGAPGAPGADGTANASVSAVVPNKAFLARKVDVQISGFGTKWDDATKVDFGAGVTVDKLTVASPTALVASVTIDKAAAVGARDVTVNAGGAATTYKGAFKVESPISVAFQGTLAQGSIILGKATGKDLSTPFDTTQEGDGLFTPLTFTGVKLGAMPGLSSDVTGVSLYSVDFSLAVDVDAPAGDKTVSLSSGIAPGEIIESPAPGALSLAARTPTALAAGTPVNGTLAKAFDSALYTFVPPASGTNLVDFAATMTGANSSARVFLLPKSGKIADALGTAAAQLIVSTNADPYYAIVFDAGGGPASAYTMRATVTAATAAAEAANDTCAGGQAASALPFVVTGATLSDATDVDWVRVTVTAADAGKKIRVKTVGGNSKTDTALQIFQSDGTTSFAAAVDRSYHEDLSSPALPATNATYCVKISASSEFVAAANTYQAVIRLE